MVEAALFLPVVVSLFLGLWQYGYALYIYNQIEQGVRDGARFASLHDYDSATTTPSPAFLISVRNVVVYGDPATPPQGTAPRVPALAPGNVNLTVGFDRGIPSTVLVSVSSYTIPGIFSSITLRGKPATQFPYLGIWAPVS